jgi:hypothetical protein
MKIQLINKTLVILFSIVLLTNLTGCKKFLNQQPITEVGPEMVFKDVNSTYQALAGVYSRLAGQEAYGIRISLYYTVDTDEMQGPSGASDNDRRDIARYSATSLNAQLEKPFNQLFTGIDYANICIDNIPKMALYSSGSDQEKKKLQRMYGEALTLRAQFYHEAIKNWGDLPANFAPAYSTAVENPFPKRVGADTLYDHLLADLELAETLVPWKNELASIGDQIDERITKGTIKALRARIALFRGGYKLGQDGIMKRPSNYQDFYAIAKKECEEIIASNQHALNTSFKALWKNQVCAHAVADPDGELMFQVSATPTSTSVGSSKLGYYNGPTVNSFGNKSINPLPTYFYSFDSADLRRDVTIAIYNVNADGITKVGQGITAINDGKYRRDWISNPVFPTDNTQFFDLKWQLIRYSDVLLMYAEAENEINGPTVAVYNAINQVRRRGYGKPITTPNIAVDLTTGLSKAQFFDKIVKERSLEFGDEGIRKFDLIRWNLLGAKIAETTVALNNMHNRVAPYDNYPTYMYFKTGTTSDDNTIAGNFWVNSFYTTAPTSTPTGTTRVNWFLNTGTTNISATLVARYATGYTAGKSELLPLPQVAIDANYNLKQNKGY